MEKEIGQFLKKERLKTGKTMEEIANFSGLSQPYISQIENEKRAPSLDALSKIIIAISRNITIEKAGEPIKNEGYSFDSLEIEYHYQHQIAERAKPYLTTDESSILVKKLIRNDFCTEFIKSKNTGLKNCSDSQDLEQFEIFYSSTLSELLDQKTDLTPILKQSYKEYTYKLNGHPLTKEEFQTLKTVLAGIAYLRKDQSS